MQRKVSKLTQATILMGSTLVSMSDAVIMPLQPAIKQAFRQIPNIDLLVNYVLVFNALFIAIGATFVGLLIEKFSKKRLLLLSYLVYGVAGTSGLYLNNIYLLIVARACLGLSVAGIMTILMTLLGDYFEGEARNKFMGLANGFSLWASVAFLFLVAPLAANSWHHPFAMYGFAFLMIPLVMLFIFDPKKPTLATSNAASKPVSYPRSLVVLIYATVFTGVTLVGLTFIKLPNIVSTKFSQDIYYTITGFAMFLATVAAASTFLYVYIKNFLHYQLVYAVIFLAMGGGFLLMSQAQLYALFLVGTGLAGFGYGMIAPNTTLWVIEVTPEQLRGRFMGLFTSLLFFAIFISPNITAIVLQYANVTTTFFLYGLVMVTLAIGLLLHGVYLLRKS